MKYHFILARTNKVGFFVQLTNTMIKANKTLRIYGEEDVVEKAFMTSKPPKDMP